jgi:hypothetical protein
VNEVRVNEVRVNEVKLKMEEIVNDDNDEEDSDSNIFKLLKKVPTLETNDNKITVLQNEVKVLNNKLDLILELLKTKN